MLQFIDNILGAINFDTFYHVIRSSENYAGQVTYTYGWDYIQLIRYSLAGILLILSFVIVYRIIIYIVNCLGARGSRKL